MVISFYANNGKCHLSKDEEVGLCGHDLSMFARFGQCRDARAVAFTVPYIEGNLGMDVCTSCLIEIALEGGCNGVVK